MINYFDQEKKKLLNLALKFQNNKIPDGFTKEFLSLVDKVNLSLMEEREDFYGYFLLQMKREIDLHISGPTAVNFKGTNYVIYFNPIQFLKLNMKQMESSIKHEILHIVSRHLIRAKSLIGKYESLAINMAMDVVVNTYLNDLPSYATTLEWVNVNYALDLLPFETFEYYLDKIQKALDTLKKAHGEKENTTNEIDDFVSEYSVEKTHDLWMESDELEEKTFQYFTEQYINKSKKGEIPTYIDGLISSMKVQKSEIPWNLYLNRLMGVIESDKKKTTMRRSRRQPERLDLKGSIKNYKAKIAVALDISGSISDEEFKQAMTEVFMIVKSYKHEITIIECDSEIRRVYQVKTIKDIKERFHSKGSTQFDPVFAFANSKKFDLLVYFTDGKGEDSLKTIPKKYRVLWVIAGGGDSLSVKNPYGIVKRLKRVKKKEDQYDMNDVRIDGYSMNNQQPIL
ncbi:MAG: VWA-like domain-containing protein [Lachnospiraceae bacterium]